MKSKNIKPYIYSYISILALIILLASKSIARFTAKKNYNGSINITNHPGDSPLGSGAKAILEKEGGIETIKAKGTPDFRKIADTKEGMFMAEDDYGESYYYRGVSDNWVSFAGLYWRIIRINGDGSIRLIYSGTKDNHEGLGTQIGTNAYNSISNAEKYGDYRISTVKGVVDNWYKINIFDKGHDNKIADTGYCNDMTKENENNFQSGYRVLTRKPPKLKMW